MLSLRCLVMGLRVCLCRSWEIRSTKLHAGGKPLTSRAHRDAAGSPVMSLSPTHHLPSRSAHGNRGMQGSDSAGVQVESRPKGQTHKKKTKKRQSEVVNLLAELPFLHTDISAEFSIKEQHQGKRKRKGWENERKGDAADTDEQKRRPNYFVAIPITNNKVAAGVQAVQEGVVQRDPRLMPALIPVATLHITMLVAHLATEQVSNAVSAMELCQKKLRTLVPGPPVVLPFEGIGDFKNEVAFVKISDGHHMSILNEIAETIHTCFEEKGIAVADGKAFKPHLTFMKLSRASKLRRQGIRKIDPSLYEDSKEESFGGELLHRLDLCAMLKKKQLSGFYHCEATIALGDQPVVKEEEVELAALSRRLVDTAVKRAVLQLIHETRVLPGGAEQIKQHPWPAGDQPDTPLRQTEE
ncbi:A-kinase anchor protein 7-like isoform X1 [Petromyzon marinus]|uniref:A-kinase anchor protein 7-like isoform X1 n=2 Tax=Petromyzon marinus TaxID=7757 RepID=UPI003F704868